MPHPFDGLADAFAARLKADDRITAWFKKHGLKQPSLFDQANAETAKPKPSVSPIPPGSTKPKDIDFYAASKPSGASPAASNSPKPSNVPPSSAKSPTAPIFGQSGHYDPAKHPHKPAGDSHGGEFAPKSGGGAHGYVPKPYVPGPLDCHYTAGPDGKKVCTNPLHVDVTPTGPATWSDAGALAVWSSGSAVPKVMNGIPFQTWKKPEGVTWNSVSGQNPFPEPPMPPEFNLAAWQDDKGKWHAPAVGHVSAGVIMVEPDGRYWVVEPKHNYGGYKTTFPKGTVDKGETLQAAAIRETWEESGLKARLVGYLGDYKGDTSITRYYFAVRSSGTPADFGHETHQVKLVPPDQLRALFNKKRDQQIFDDLVAKGFIHIPSPSVDKTEKATAIDTLAESFVASLMLARKAWEEEKHPRKPAGDKAGGQFAPAAGGEALELPQTFWKAHHEIVDSLKKGALTPVEVKAWIADTAENKRSAAAAGEWPSVALYKTQVITYEDALKVAAGEKPTAKLMEMQGEHSSAAGMSEWQAAKLPWLKDNPWPPKTQAEEVDYPAYAETLDELNKGITTSSAIVDLIASGKYGPPVIAGWKKALAEYEPPVPQVNVPVAPAFDQATAISKAFDSLQVVNAHALPKAMLKAYLNANGTEAVVEIAKIHAALDAMEKGKFPGAHMVEALKYGTIDGLLKAEAHGDMRAAAIKAELGKAKPVVPAIDYSQTEYATAMDFLKGAKITPKEAEGYFTDPVPQIAQAWRKAVSDYKAFYLPPENAGIGGMTPEQLHAALAQPHQPEPGETEKAWDETKHPRGATGTPAGGEFVSKSGYLDFSDKSEEETDAWYKERGDPWWKRLRKSEQDAYMWWVEDGNVPLNDFLRTGEADGHKDLLFNRALTLRGAMMPLDTNVVVYRGINGDASVYQQVGKSFSDKGFTATSLDPEKAIVYSESKPQTVARIHVPQGTMVGYAFVGQHELLLPQRSKFRITGISQRGEVHIVDMDYVS